MANIFDLFKKIGDTVEEGEPLYRVYTCTSDDMSLAESVIESSNGYTIQ